MTIGLGLLLAGCASPQATPAPTESSSATPSPTPTPQAPPLVATIVIAGTEIRSVLADGTPGETIPYSAPPEEALAFLSRAFGSDPVRVQTEEAHCSPSHSLATWDDMVKVTLGGPWTPVGQTFSITALAGEYAGVVLDTPTGESVGEDAANLLSALPADRLHRFGGSSNPYTDALYEHEGGDLYSAYEDDPAWGAIAFVENGTIERIAAPTYLGAGSSC